MPPTYCEELVVLGWAVLEESPRLLPMGIQSPGHTRAGQKELFQTDWKYSEKKGNKELRPRRADRLPVVFRSHLHWSAGVAVCCTCERKAAQEKKGAALFCPTFQTATKNELGVSRVDSWNSGTYSEYCTADWAGKQILDIECTTCLVFSVICFKQTIWSVRNSTETGLLKALRTHDLVPEVQHCISLPMSISNWVPDMWLWKLGSRLPLRAFCLTVASASFLWGFVLVWTWKGSARQGLGSGLSPVV